MSKTVVKRPFLVEEAEHLKPLLQLFIVVAFLELL